MPRLTVVKRRQHYRLRQVAVTALLLASSPSAAFVSSTAYSGVIPLVASTCRSASSLAKSSWGSGLRGGSSLDLTSRSRFGIGVPRTTTTERTMSSSTTTDVDATATTVSMTPASKLEALRSKMKELNLDVYLVPSDDPHLSGKYL
jgi:hypothetical protein